MRKALLTILIVGAAGALLASNMGFKLSYNLVNAGTVGNNWVSLPYYYTPADLNSNSLVDAEDLCDDIGGPCAAASSCSIGRWNTATDAPVTWTFQGTRGTPFTLTAGESVFVKVKAGTTFVVVGSHNPSLGYALANAGTVGNNWFSVPYHANLPDNNANSLMDAEDLCDDIGGPCAAASSCTIGRWNTATDAPVTWTCQGTRGTPFTLTTGEGVFIKVNANTTYTPSHY